jgi:mRNA-degrading endonuclease RelE of RelBE toxin-antitoxin system
MKINYHKTIAFEKDLSKLTKRFKTLESDLEVAKQNAIELFHLKKIDNQSVFLIQKFCSAEIQICKLKKFACKALKGRGVKSGIRVIYAYHIKTATVDFIEIYFKADQENENQRRLTEYLNEQQ